MKSKIISVLLICLFVAFISNSRLLAQGMGSNASPVVNDDMTATFKLNAPNASEVSLMFGSGTNYPMTKNDNGLWSVTIGPLEPELYTYAIMVDGLRIVDPSNPELQGGTAPGFNLLN